MSKQSKPLLTAASAGKRYIRRDGQVSGPVTRNANDLYPFMVDNVSYTPDGSFHTGRHTSVVDLIRLATPAEIRAGHVLPVKEWKAREGRTYRLWCIEYSAAHEVPEVRGLFRANDRRTARISRRDMLRDGYQCGPIFKITIACPAWSPTP